MRVGGPEGDIELMEVAAGAARAAGLADFVLDLGHADIPRALISDLPGPLAASILDALAHKDTAVLADLVRDAKPRAAVSDALVELPRLHGDAAVWKEADRLLGSTPAGGALGALHDLWNRATANGLGVVLRVDLGEFEALPITPARSSPSLPDGPGEAVGSGGRYDDLLGRFGVPMPAAGFALDLDNLAWALRVRGSEDTALPRVLVHELARVPPRSAAPSVHAASVAPWPQRAIPKLTPGLGFFAPSSRESGRQTRASRHRRWNLSYARRGAGRRARRAARANDGIAIKAHVSKEET